MEVGEGEGIVLVEVEDVIKGIEVVNCFVEVFMGFDYLFW